MSVHPCRDRIVLELTPVRLEVDSLRFRLLLKNLLDNACHYSGEGSPIDVKTTIVDQAVELEVSDIGVGMAEHEIARLTEAFYRPDSARQRGTGGYGLGLYLCRLIAEAHGGDISIESRPGKGTRVSVSLPLDNS